MSLPPEDDATAGRQPTEAGGAGGRLRIDRLRRRADFLRAAQAARRTTPGFLLQARSRAAGEHDPSAARVGFTCSRKVGNAVARNRARRRLRAVARAVLPVAGRPGWDYVLIGRPGTTAGMAYETLLGDLIAALERIHGPRR
ncbi:MAG: ribonuclease P protein component [Rhodobacteraceae bacterium]|nr:ribonuclease P protein component [Paracoccaceae bacterium]